MDPRAIALDKRLVAQRLATALSKTSLSPRNARVVNLRLTALGSYDVDHGTTHAYPDSTDGLTDGCTVFRNGRLWFWSSARHMWMTKRVAA